MKQNGTNKSLYNEKKRKRKNTNGNPLYSQVLTGVIAHATPPWRSASSGRRSHGSPCGVVHDAYASLQACSPSAAVTDTLKFLRRNSCSLGRSNISDGERTPMFSSSLVGNNLRVQQMETREGIGNDDHISQTYITK